MRKFTALIASLLILCLPLKAWAQVSMAYYIGDNKSAVVSAQHNFSATKTVAYQDSATPPCHSTSSDAAPDADPKNTCNTCAACHTIGTVPSVVRLLTPGFTVTAPLALTAIDYSSAELSLALRPPAAI